MNKFKKITYDNFEKIDELLKDNVKETKRIYTLDHEYGLSESMIDCESPIEQLLAMEFERIGLIDMNKFNPFVDVLEIENQSNIVCNGKRYRVDFAIHVWYKNQGGKTFIIECDGYEFHQKTKEQVDRDNKRTRSLQKKGYEVIRFSGTEIYHMTHKCALEVINIILSKCEYKRG
jgi:hypothetical protein